MGSTEEALDEYGDDLDELAEQVRAGIKQLAKLKGDKRDNKVKFLRTRIKRMRTLLRTYKVEMRELSKADAAPYQEKYTDYEEMVTRLTQDLDWAKSDGDRAELVGGAGGAGGTGGANELDRDQKLARADALQKEDLKAMSRMEQTIAQTQVVGGEVIERLHEQTKQMEGIADDLDEQHDLLGQANKQLRAFARRMMTDKIIMCFTCFVFVGLIVLVALAIFLPRETGLDMTTLPSDLPARLNIPGFTRSPTAAPGAPPPPAATPAAAPA
mmetsp:Transcript_27202/g.66016  ORF Transcript_27202/g.66016 Transcript_27202/m.66016 type:complete len:270 (+) Transcript_27202:145-954(+)